MLGRKTTPIIEQQDEKRGFDAFDLRMGDIMRGERATMGKSLLDVQRELKIKATYIAAVENADPSVFESPGFIAGYVRSYARYLGLDADWAYDRFCAESGFTGIGGLSGNGPVSARKQVRSSMRSEDAIARPMAPYAPIGESMLSRVEPGAIGSVAVVFALIGIIGYGGWSVLQEVQRVQFAPIDEAPGVTANLDTLTDAPVSPDSAETAIAGDFSPPAADALDRLYRPQALDTPVLTARDGPIASLDPDSGGAFIPLPDERLASASIPTAPDAFGPDALPQPGVQVLEDTAPDVVLFAVRPAWIRVASVDGTILFEKILDTGERYVLPQSDEAPILRAGNSGSLYFSVKGQTYGPAGPGTSVAKNVALGIDAITESYAHADPEADPVLADVLTAMAATQLAEPAVE